MSLRAVVVTLTATGVAVLAAAAPSTAQAPAPVTVKLKVLKAGRNRLIATQLMIKGKKYSMLVDTGASTTLIDSGVAAKLKLTRVGRVGRASGVGGIVKVQPVRLSTWSIGGRALPVSTIGSSRLGSSGGLIGLLGSDVLSRFGKVTIDYAAGVMTLGG